jgi:hypothetical protein
MPACYVDSGVPLRLRVTDEDDVNLPGYPMDDIVPEIADGQDASGIAFNPTDANPSTNVQDAIEYAGTQFTDQSSILTRALTGWATGGTADAYTITPSPAITSYGSHQFFFLQIDRANTGAATVNVNGLGERDLRKLSRASVPEALAAGDLQPGMVLPCWYDGTRFVAMVPGVAVSGSNSNGAYTRFPNGLQIATHTVSGVSLAINNAFEGGFRSIAQTWTFPSAFVSRPNVTSQPRSGSSFSSQSRGDGATSGTYYWTNIQSVTASDRAIELTAIGRWY